MSSITGFFFEIQPLDRYIIHFHFESVMIRDEKNLPSIYHENSLRGRGLRGGCLMLSVVRFKAGRFEYFALVV